MMLANHGAICASPEGALALDPLRIQAQRVFEVDGADRCEVLAEACRSKRAGRKVDWMHSVIGAVAVVERSPLRSHEASAPNARLPAYCSGLLSSPRCGFVRDRGDVVRYRLIRFERATRRSDFP